MVKNQFIDPKHEVEVTLKELKLLNPNPKRRGEGGEER